MSDTDRKYLEEIEKQTLKRKEFLRLKEYKNQVNVSVDVIFKTN